MYWNAPISILLELMDLNRIRILLGLGYVKFIHTQAHTQAVVSVENFRWVYSITKDI